MDDEANTLAAEVAEWQARQQAARRWDVSRTKCGFWALIQPLVLGVLAWIVVLIGAGNQGYDAGLALPAALVAFAFGLALSFEFVVLALRGGGLEATGEGLEYHLVRANGLLRWTDLDDAEAERRVNTKGGTYPVLAIWLSHPVRSWPLSIVLWGSNRDCLCITPYIFVDPAAAIAAGIETARAGAVATRMGVSNGQRRSDDPRPNELASAHLTNILRSASDVVVTPHAVYVLHQPRGRLAGPDDVHRSGHRARAVRRR